ncbi:adenylosuccinate synthase [Candidatus Thorarchaeota archaeon]|nr:MAG: adenylosuccinate synthase [Candidatus Thorarchaeota archaeon]
MSNLVVIGLQWGDEGKGKIVDVLSENFDIVTRFQGGSNAGHTVIIGEDVFKFRLMPTGAVRGKKVVIGNGVVVDPFVLVQEIEQLQSMGLTFDLLVSDRSHFITPFHILLDELQEKEKGNQKIGTTKRGIGPTYADKISRIGVRACDLINGMNATQWKILDETSSSRIQRLHEAEVDENTEKLLNDYSQALKQIMPLVGDASDFLNNAIDSGQRILFEGAQGTLLDIDHGTYPFVTSSNCVSAAASTGTGVSPKMLGSILGITKAYLTRVGAGPFPTELDNDTGEYLRTRGGEFGTVTGRPRRCGWLDIVALKYAVRVNGAEYLAVTKIDVLTGLDSVKVCVGYDIDGTEVKTIPASSETYSKVSPIYEQLDGWSELPGISGNPDPYSSLPDSMMNYLGKIEKWTGSKVAIVSMGPDRADTIQVPGVLPDIFIDV